MEGFIGKLKKIPVPILVVIGLLVILILVQIAGVNGKKQKNKEEKFKFQIEKEQNVYKLIKQLQDELLQQKKQLEALKNKQFGIIQSNKEKKLTKIQEKKLKNLVNRYGEIIDKKVLPDGSILITTADGKKFKVLPDGTVVPVKDYTVDENGNITITGMDGKKQKILVNKKDKNIENLVKKHGKIIDKKVLPDGSVLITTADGKKFKVLPDGTVVPLQDYKVNSDGSITITDKDGKVHKIDQVFKNLKEKDNPITSVIDANGNKYIKDKDGNWYMITPDGKKIKVGKNLKIDKNGNIVVDGKVMGKAVSIKRKNGMVVDSNGNVYYEKEIPSKTKTKGISKIPEKLKELAKKHGKILEKHMLAAGSMIIKTADGKILKVNPDGTVEELKDFKVNPDGTINYTTKFGKKVTAQVGKLDKKLKELAKKHGKILEKHMLAAGSMIIKTADGKILKVNPDGTVEELKDFKINPDGTINYTTKDGKKVINKLSKSEDGIKNLETKHGKIVDEHILPDGSRIITTADGKKFKINPDGTITELSDYKVNPDGTITYTSKNGKTITSEISKVPEKLEELSKKHGKILEKHMLAAGSMIIKTADGKILKVNPDGTVEELKDYKVNPDGTITYTTKGGKKVIVKQGLDGKTEEIGEGKIVIDKNGKAHIVITKTYKVNLGKMVRSVFDLEKNDFYEEINGKVYKNYKYVKNGNIYLKAGKVIIKYTDNTQEFIIKPKNILLKTLYYINENEDTIYELTPDKKLIIFDLNNKTITQYPNVSYTVNQGKLKVKTSSQVIVKVKLSKNNILPTLFTNKGNIISEDFNYIHVFNNKTMPFMFTTFKEINNNAFNNNNYILSNNNKERYILKYQKKVIANVYSNYRIKIGNVVFDTSRTYLNKTITEKPQADAIGYIANNIYGAYFRKNLFIGNNTGYSLIANISINNSKNVLFIKHKYKTIDFGNIIDIQKSYLLDNGKIVTTGFNGYNYLTEKYSYTNIGKGTIVIKNGKVYLKDKNGKLHLLGGLSQNNNMNVKNGEFVKTMITKNELDLLKALNSKDYMLLNYGQQIELVNGDRYFYNNKLEVIQISNLSGVNNLGEAKILINKKTRKAYLIKKGKTIYLGLVSNIDIKDSTVYQTTKGMYYILNNNIYKIDNKKLINLKLVPYIDKNILYGLDLVKRMKYNLGIILNTFTGTLKNPSMLNKETVKNMANANIETGEIWLGKKFVITANGKVYKLRKGKRIFYGTLVGTTPNYYYIIKNNLTGINEVYDANGNRVNIKKTGKNKFEATVNGKKVNIKIKQKGNKLEIDGKSFNDVLFDNSYLYSNNNNIKILDKKQQEALFNQELKLKPNKLTSNVRTENSKYDGTIETNYPKIKIKIVSLSSKKAYEKNIEIFKQGKPENTTEYILDDGSVVTSFGPSKIRKSYFLPVGTKIYAKLAGGSIAPLLVGGTKIDKNSGILDFIQNNNISLFIVDKNVILPNGQTVPIKNAKITANPIGTTLQRVVYELKSITFYDEDHDKWYYSDKISGAVLSEKDLVAGLPAVLIDYRDKYMAKATIYSILQGITQYLVATKSPIAAVDATTNSDSTDSGSTDLGGTLGQTVLGGASEQMKNINDLMMAILQSQIPYLVVKNGEPAIIRLNTNLWIKELREKSK